MNQNLQIGFAHQAKLFRNLSVPVLAEHALANKEGVFNDHGSLICMSGKYTGRSPKDKFFVHEPSSEKHIWWGPVNQKMERSAFETLQGQVFNFLKDKNLYQFDGFAGADPKHRMKVRFYTTKAWHAYFVQNMFIRPKPADLKDFVPDFTIYNACEYSAPNWKDLKLNSEVFIAFDIGKKIGLIGGTEYGGEMKKGIFSIMNYHLPLKEVMAMHCSATVGEKGDVAVYFGLSGTGKTTLSADPERILIGDDEHGWSDQGVFNFEGGCYAKTIKLSPTKEKEIWGAIRFGSLLENVEYNPETRVVDYDSAKVTENTRISYPIHFMPRFQESGMAGHPSYVIMLTCDAFGVLPPVSKLTPEQANYHFLSGYTAKVAGTERGVTEPTATFSTCFGKPFMTLNPKVYGDLLAKKMHQHNAKAYLVNTGWVGKGARIDLPKTRLIIEHILKGVADKAEYWTDPVFGLNIPKSLPGLDEKFLNPEKGWQNPVDFKATQLKLAKMFIENFAQFADFAKSLEVYGPKI